MKTSYFAIADRIGNEEAVDLLRQHGREETVHGERVRRVADLLAP